MKKVILSALVAFIFSFGITCLVMGIKHQYENISYSAHVTEYLTVEEVGDLRDKYGVTNISIGDAVSEKECLIPTFIVSYDKNGEDSSVENLEQKYKCCLTELKYNNFGWTLYNSRWFIIGATVISWFVFFVVFYGISGIERKEDGRQ